MLITYDHVQAILKDAHLSAEQLASRLGISGMTLRRWEQSKKNDPLPEIYQRALVDAIYQLLSEGLLDKDSVKVAEILKSSEPTSFVATLRSLGLSDTYMQGGEQSEDKIVDGLAKIGSNPDSQTEVLQSEEKINGYGHLGGEWKSRIKLLMSAIKSNQISTFEKCAAFGALIYLLTPFDIIPDHLPVFGLLDDFAMLGLAVMYYKQRFPQLFKNS